MTDTAPHPVAFLDTETTGLDPDRHEIWEVGLIDREGAEHEWQLPVDLSRVDPKASEINGMNERYDLSRLTPLWKFIDEFAELTAPRTELVVSNVFRTMKCHFAGAVVSFDEERLRRLFQRVGRRPHEWHYHLIDVEALAAGFLAAEPPTVDAELYGTAAPPWNSDDLSRSVGVDPADFDRHTALGDARWAKAIYEAVML